MSLLPNPGRKGAEPATEGTVFDAVGGRPYFERLVERFYLGVAADPVLRPLYPEDLTESKRHLAGFLAQYWGGGEVQYSAERGHPRLRMRHARFVIGPAERDAWLRHMGDALAESGVSPELAARMLEYFTMAADHLAS